MMQKSLLRGLPEKHPAGSTKRLRGTGSYTEEENTYAWSASWHPKESDVFRSYSMRNGSGFPEERSGTGTGTSLHEQTLMPFLTLRRE